MQLNKNITAAGNNSKNELEWDQDRVDTSSWGMNVPSVFRFDHFLVFITTHSPIHKLFSL